MDITKLLPVGIHVISHLIAQIFEFFHHLIPHAVEIALNFILLIQDTSGQACFHLCHVAFNLLDS